MTGTFATGGDKVKFDKTALSFTAPMQLVPDDHGRYTYSVGRKVYPYTKHSWSRSVTGNSNPLRVCAPQSRILDAPQTRRETRRPTPVPTPLDVAVSLHLQECDWTDVARLHRRPSHLPHTEFCDEEYRNIYYNGDQRNFNHMLDGVVDEALDIAQIDKKPRTPTCVLGARGARQTSRCWPPGTRRRR
ncbi:hypothetical protein F4820DRAFT_454066 [Hypoxylon rubiginosum]|uniref:Uncharacterized protein n=1 Tax=Hypoxylon rubiginosum TaxID=110542 RepID=A0ACB9YJE3_9PEZI|nr:hypothetical protein F4820DRAFT_454066 [Hypoxylon rubiginosum]